MVQMDTSRLDGRTQQTTTIWETRNRKHLHGMDYVYSVGHFGLTIVARCFYNIVLVDNHLSDAHISVVLITAAHT